VAGDEGRTYQNGAKIKQVEWGKMHNPNNRRQVVNFIILIVGFCLISIFAGYVFGYGTGDDFSIIVGWILAISYGGLLLAILIRKEFIQRPRYVELIGTGVMLTSRLGSQRFVPWDNIRHLAIDFATPERWHGQIYHDAKIKLFDGSEILVIHDIAMAVKKAYETATGRSMPHIKWG
jgi:hypothetical protein